MPFTQAGKDAKLNLYGRGGTIPSTWHLALTSTDPGTSGSMSGELSGGGYARLAVPNNISTWAAPVAGTGTNRRSMRNAVEIAFPPSNGAQGVAAYVVAMSASSSGVAHWYQAIGPYDINNSNYVVRFPIGQLELFEED